MNKPLSHEEMVEQLYSKIRDKGKIYKINNLVYIRKNQKLPRASYLQEVVDNHYLVKDTSISAPEKLISEQELHQKYEYYDEAPKELQELGYKIYNEKNKVIAVRAYDIIEPNTLEFSFYDSSNQLVIISEKDFLVIPLHYPAVISKISQSDFESRYIEE